VRGKIDKPVEGKQRNLTFIGLAREDARLHEYQIPSNPRLARVCRDITCNLL
jgi:hypothetical protein